MKGVEDEAFIQMKRDRVNVTVGSEYVVTALSDKEVEQLLFYVEDQTKVSIRNKLIVYLLFYTGVRVTELVEMVTLSVLLFGIHRLIPEHLFANLAHERNF